MCSMWWPEGRRSSHRGTQAVREEALGSQHWANGVGKGETGGKSALKAKPTLNFLSTCQCQEPGAEVSPHLCLGSGGDGSLPAHGHGVCAREAPWSTAEARDQVFSATRGEGDVSRVPRGAITQSTCRIGAQLPGVVGLKTESRGFLGSQISPFPGKGRLLGERREGV